MKLRLRKNLWSGIITALFGLVMCIAIPIYIKVTVRTLTAAVGPDYLPTIIAWIMIVTGILLIINSLIFKKDSFIEIDISKEKKVLLFAALLLVYVFLIAKIGFLLCSFLFTPLFLFFQGDRKKSHYLGIEMLVITLWAVFVFLLKVPLP